MGQLFRPSSNTIAKASIFGVLGLLAIGLWLPWQLFRSQYVTGVGVAIEQPIQFSHEHHVGGLGIDCRYCHTSVEQSYFAGMPATKTCMTCHSQIWNNAELLKPVRDSWRTQQGIQWKKVHNLPDYAHFNHSIHVNKGMGCSTCHVEIDKMPLVWKVNTLQMSWCIDCHKAPEKNIRPRDQVYNMAWTTPENQAELGAELVKKYGIKKEQLINCSVCHY